MNRDERAIQFAKKELLEGRGSIDVICDLQKLGFSAIDAEALVIQAEEELEPKS